MSYTDRYDNTVDFDFGGGPDAWEVLTIRITAPGEQDATVQIPLHLAVKILAAATADAAGALAAQHRSAAPVPTVIHEGELYRMPKDDGYVWTTARGRSIQWDGDRGDWAVTSAGDTYTAHWSADALPEALAPTHYPITLDQR